jgi:hypothetical protein
MDLMYSGTAVQYTSIPVYQTRGALRFIPTAATVSFSGNDFAVVKSPRVQYFEVEKAETCVPCLAAAGQWPCKFLQLSTFPFLQGCEIFILSYLLFLKYIVQ